MRYRGEENAIHDVISSEVEIKLLALEGRHSSLAAVELVGGGGEGAEEVEEEDEDEEDEAGLLNAGPRWTQLKRECGTFERLKYKRKLINYY